ncbi:MAG: RNA methyltransferase [Gemmatimonadetes bacterium]|nr:RNA methyltransferase [Gemmatimonadota bacterium]
MNPLDNIRVVLVEPATPGNIGATARVLKTTGISQLVLVNPKAWDTPETRAFAHGAGDILDGSQIFPSLAAAVANCHIVVGTTHRQGRFRALTSAPRPLIDQLASQVHHRRIALVFGRERDGLWHEELALCHQVLRFPTAVAYPSLNLSHAVLLLTYGLYAAVSEKSPDPPVQLATADERERMFAQILQALAEIEFTPYNNKPDHFGRVLRRFFNKVDLEVRDVRAIQTICGQIRKFSRRYRRSAGRTGAD